MPEWRLEELAPGVFARAGVSHPLLPNSGIIVGEEGVCVIDSGYSAASGRALLADVRRITALPVTTVVISHHHFDHAWGNEVFTGATLVGHENARRAMEVEPEVYRAQMLRYVAQPAAWYGLAPERLAAEFGETRITPPTKTYADRMTPTFAGPRIELRYLGPGHTSGDTVVHLPEAGVLFGGDLICNQVFPNALDGDPLRWPDTLQAIDQLAADIIVPGHGPVSDRRLTAEFDHCIAALTSEVRAALDNGAADARAVSATLRLDEFGDWVGRELLPGTVRAIYRALAAERKGR